MRKSEKQKLDIIGRKFGKLKVEEFVEMRNKKSYYKCLCKCGVETILPRYHLTRKDDPVTSCGCASITRSKRAFQDITGKVYNELTVISRAPNRGKETRWVCRCSCGRTTIVQSNSLKSGLTKSCGHLAMISHSEKAFLDGLEKVIGHKILRQETIKDSNGDPVRPIRYYDGRVSGTKTLIEVDGSHWHTDQAAVDNDKFKTERAFKYGYNLIRVVVDDKDGVQDALELPKVFRPIHMELKKINKLKNTISLLN